MSTGFEFGIKASEYSEVDKKYHTTSIILLPILTQEDVRKHITYYVNKNYELEHIEIKCYSSYDMEYVYWEMSAKEWLAIIDTEAGLDLNPFKDGYMDLTSGWDSDFEPTPAKYYYIVETVDRFYRERNDGSSHFGLVWNSDGIANAITIASNEGIALELTEITCFNMAYLAPHYGADTIEWRIGVEDWLIKSELS